MDPFKVVLADDHDIFREGLKSLFHKHSRGVVCGEARNGEGAVDLVLQLHPDLVVLDLSMPGMNGIQAAVQIRQLAPATKIVMISMHSGEAIAQLALQAGVDLYIEKSDASSALIPKIEAVLDERPRRFEPKRDSATLDVD